MGTMLLTQQPFLLDGPDNAPFTILLAHGAGAPMDSLSMTAIMAALVHEGFRVARFEFDYMSARRTGPLRQPPPKAEKLIPQYLEAIELLGSDRPLIIGGKSMGGRIASMIADQRYKAGEIQGLLCLGYPFHPPARPDQLRTAHLETLVTPALICQGKRDVFGTESEVATYLLSKSIEFCWLEDGDHDFKPRKKLTGFSLEDHLATVAKRTKAWSETLTVR